jgi:hypothetical protein
MNAHGKKVESSISKFIGNRIKTKVGTLSITLRSIGKLLYEAQKNRRRSGGGH